MPSIGQPERVTQERVVALFRDELDYRHLGDWTDRAGNSHIEDGLLTDYLSSAGYSTAQIGRALNLLRQEANHFGRSLYDNNKAVYALLRYGVPLKTAAR
jgi:type I restriction enzyme, R subunit